MPVPVARDLVANSSANHATCVLAANDCRTSASDIAVTRLIAESSSSPESGKASSATPIPTPCVDPTSDAVREHRGEWQRCDEHEVRHHTDHIARRLDAVEADRVRRRVHRPVYENTEVPPTRMTTRGSIRAAPTTSRRAVLTGDSGTGAASAASSNVSDSARPRRSRSGRTRGARRSGTGCPAPVGHGDASSGAHDGTEEGGEHGAAHRRHDDGATPQGAVVRAGHLGDVGVERPVSPPCARPWMQRTTSSHSDAKAPTWPYVGGDGDEDAGRCDERHRQHHDELAAAAVGDESEENRPPSVASRRPTAKTAIVDKRVRHLVVGVEELVREVDREDREDGPVEPFERVAHVDREISGLCLERWYPYAVSRWKRS